MKRDSLYLNPMELSVVAVAAWHGNVGFTQTQSTQKTSLFTDHNRGLSLGLHTQCAELFRKNLITAVRVFV